MNERIAGDPDSRVGYGTQVFVNFDADSSCIGQFVDVVITEALPNSLRGRLDIRNRAGKQRSYTVGS